MVWGRVQGVGYRAWVARLAGQHDMAGTVQNTAEGAVEVHVRGPSAEMPRFEARLLEGPVFARVTNVTRTDSGQTLPAEFRILR
ncbi:MAG: acylphosphatase [Gemmatimonadota bacterium]